ncbi:MAG: bifunctional phosphoribosyl-AMP cyclohydrolase/phosphoribosyl-ATP diphosphatase HisIE [Coriobacteriia bacterium]|nr:bifunctional phosphoribosyl-AMP cyclohydrolase/phosphoribosyl-ATP diphosphatase HisIE [Coriobacteriia bacterium]
MYVDRERDSLDIEDLKYDDSGLIPAIVQQHDTGEILMLAYMNAASLAKTVETGYTWFWSRSRQKYWQKGESSGHVQAVREIRYDCDADTLLVTVDQVGPGACHTGERSCFYRTLWTAPSDVAGSGAAPDLGDVLTALFGVLEQRKRDMPEGSYTAKLLAGPEDSLLKKIAEESGEVIMAAKDADVDHLRYEIADLVYHLLVVMTRHGIALGDLAAELDGRSK